MNPKVSLVPLLATMLLHAAPIAALEAGAPVSQPRDSILVLDGSGSMWGAIEGRHKILIARDVISDVLSTMAPDTRLGLMAYGHTRKGDCEDIELLVAPGASRSRISAAVQQITPLGKTPLSAAVQQAAAHLQSTKRPATVVLVSDGEETCNLDPCTVGAELEQAGVDFTAHVVGFGLASDEQQTGLRCLAERTGGTYFRAADAHELALALQETVKPAANGTDAGSTANKAETAELRLQATDLTSGPRLEEGLNWRISAVTDPRTVYESPQSEGSIELDALVQGRYQIHVRRTKDAAAAEASVFLYQGDKKTVTLAVEVPLTAHVRTEPDTFAPAGSTVKVHWEGPDRKHDWIGIAKPEAAPDDYLYYRYTKRGSPVTLKLPIEEGEWEVRYVVGKPARILARQNFTTTPIPPASLNAAESVVAGVALDVQWTGPNYPNDQIVLAEPGVSSKRHYSYTYTKRGSPLQIKTPIDSGDYELRYISAQGKKILASRPLTVTAVTATLRLPATAIAGGSIEAIWEGPNYRGDWVGTAKQGDKPTRHTTHAYTRKGSPLQIPAPPDAGDYLVRYVSHRKVLAEQAIKILPVTASLTAPTFATAGSRVDVRWEGPDYKSDYIALSPPGAKARDYVSYSYTGRGSPVSLTLPSEPGIYELRYVMAAGRRIIASTLIEVR